MVDGPGEQIYSVETVEWINLKHRKRKLVYVYEGE